MNGKLIYSVAACLLIATTACRKEDVEKPPPAQLPEYLPKTIAWDNGATATLTYNTDNTLNKVEYAYLASRGETVYLWSDNKLVEFYQEESLYKNEFEYDEQGRVVKMRHAAKAVPLHSEYLLEFRYDTQGRVLTLKLYLKNIAGTYLQTETVYQYKSNGDLFEAVTRAGDNIITYRLDAYSPPVSFNACNYIGYLLSDDYVIYNYPVMMQLDKLNKLPAKISRSRKLGSNPAVVDHIIEQSYNVINYRIDKVSTLTFNPGLPGSEQTIEATYSYF